MVRPSQYRESYVLNRNMPYETVESLASGAYLNGGVLGKGKQVWMQHESQETTCGHAVSVYAEDIGIINLDPHCLSRLD